MRRGRPPKHLAPLDLPEELRGQIDAAIDSAADEPAAAIFRRFGLAQRGLVEDTFRRYVARRRRRDRRAREAEVAAARPEAAPSWEEIDGLARREALRRLYAGDAKVYELVLLSRSRREADRLELSRIAEQRAAEMHEAKMAKFRELKAEADSKLDRLVVEKRIPDDVAERIKDLYGIAV